LTTTKDANLGLYISSKYQLNLGASIIVANVDSTNMCGDGKKCSDKGSCNTTTKACVCNATFAGFDCSKTKTAVDSAAADAMATLKNLKTWP
jgi:hypothetical protein